MSSLWGADFRRERSAFTYRERRNFVLGFTEAVTDGKVRLRFPEAGYTGEVSKHQLDRAYSELARAMDTKPEKTKEAVEKLFRLIIRMRTNSQLLGAFNGQPSEMSKNMMELVELGFTGEEAKGWLATAADFGLAPKAGAETA